MFPATHHDGKTPFRLPGYESDCPDLDEVDRVTDLKIQSANRTTWELVWSQLLERKVSAVCTIVFATHIPQSLHLGWRGCHQE